MRLTNTVITCLFSTRPAGYLLSTIFYYRLRTIVNFFLHSQGLKTIYESKIYLFSLAYVSSNFMFNHHDFNTITHKGLCKQRGWWCSWPTYLSIKGTFCQYTGRFTAFLTRGFTDKTRRRLPIRQSYMHSPYHSTTVSLAVIVDMKCTNGNQLPVN